MSCAARFDGSSFSALLASVLAVPRLPAVKSSCASTRYAFAEGPSVKRRLRLFARRIRVAAALAHLGQAGVRLGALSIRSHCRLVQPLRLEQQSAIEISLRLCAQRLRPIARSQSFQPPGIHLVHHRRRLFKGGGVKAAHNPFQRI